MSEILVSVLLATNPKMTSLSLKHRIFIVKAFFKGSESVPVTQDAFKRQFKVGSPPSYQTIVDTIKRFEETGSVQDRPKAIRAKRVRSEGTIEQVKTIIEESPTKSVRKVASQAALKPSTVQQILRIDLQMHPYKATLVHGLHEHDLPKRVQFCDWFLAMVDQHPHFLSSVFFSDEASFHLVGAVNRQNQRFWGTENPNALLETKSFTPKVNVWVAMSSRQIVGPYFFEDADGQAQTINSDRYVNMLQTFFLPELRRRRIRPSSVWFQNDLATAHTSVRTVTAIEAMFPGRVIGKNLWPPRSPDITPLDSFLFGYLKGKVYKDDPQNTTELKEAIQREITQLKAETLNSVFGNIHLRIKKCRLVGGSHFQHLLK